MAKMIKFDLPIDGVKVATLDDLQDHFTTEIIEHFRSGLLKRWLRSQRLDCELTSVEALASNGDDATILAQLCEIFEVEADDDVIAAAIAEATGVPGIRPTTAAVDNAIEAIEAATRALTFPISDDAAAAIDRATKAIGVLLPPVCNVAATSAALDALYKAVFKALSTLNPLAGTDDLTKLLYALLALSAAMTARNNDLPFQERGTLDAIDQALKYTLAWRPKA